MNVGLPNTLLVIRQDSAFLADASQQKNVEQRNSEQQQPRDF